jgi:Uma2 family endonuclease
MRRGIDGLENLGRPPVKKPLPTVPISFEEFLDWCDEDTRAEWVNGRVVLMSPVSMEHQLLLTFLIQVVGMFVDHHELGKVFFAPFLMRLSAVPSAREPDLIFVAKEREALFQRLFLDGPADLAVEIVSRWSVRRDGRDKFREYEVAGVREYWLIDPARKSADFYTLESNGKYSAVDIGEDGLFRSRVVDGLFLRPEWLWNAPSAMDVLRELKVI